MSEPCGTPHVTAPANGVLEAVQDNGVVHCVKHCRQVEEDDQRWLSCVSCHLYVICHPEQGYLCAMAWTKT